MPDSTAPRVFVSYAQDSPDHVEQVHAFATFLRSDIGLDVALDLWHENVRRDWSSWAAKQLTEADFVLVIASPKYKRSAEGTARPDEGRGSQFEASIIVDHLTGNLQRGIQRILPVILPGKSIKDVPVFLTPHSTTRFQIAAFTEEGVSTLLAAITGRAKYPLPARGEWNGGASREHTVPRRRLLHGMQWSDSSPDIRADRAVIDGVQYDASIVLRPTSSTLDESWFVEVDLNGAYRRLRSVAGVLDDAREIFQVGQFRVCVDGESRYEGRASRGKPGEVDVDVTGGMKLRLEMYRPFAAAGARRSKRLPELAWGDPALF